jgi:hypothetical protein
MKTLLALLLLLAGPAAAAEPVDLLLVLAVDASGSVNRARFELQRDGYAAALRNPRVQAAIRGGMIGAIAITMTQWTGPELHEIVVPWRRIDTPASANEAADAIAVAPRKIFGGGTSISGAIDHALGLLETAPFEATRRVIDISGDGANNRGRPAADARDDAVARGITINGLPITSVEPDLDDSYRADVIGGPGAFTIPASRYENFASAILQKLIREIASLK